LSDAIDFLSDVDVLVVALGFDTLDIDGTSGFNLKIVDFEKIAAAIKAKFGNRVAIVLEGGYVKEALSDCVSSFSSAWK